MVPVTVAAPGTDGAAVGMRCAFEPEPGPRRLSPDLRYLARARAGAFRVEPEGRDVVPAFRAGIPVLREPEEPYS